MPSVPPMRKSARVIKVDESLGIVFGWAIVSTEDGQPYYDLQGDHIPEDAMTKAAADFMQNGRVAREMHSGGRAGTVLFAFPLGADTAKAFGIQTRRTGLMIGVRPDAEMMAKFRSGE